MSNANAPVSPLSVEDVITDVVGGGTEEPRPEKLKEEAGTQVVGGGTEKPSQEKLKEDAGTQAKAEKKSKKGHKYFISVLGRHLKKLKPFKLTWKILRGIGKAMRIAGRSVKQVFVCSIMVIGFILWVVGFLIIGIPMIIYLAFSLFSISCGGCLDSAEESPGIMAFTGCCQGAFFLS